jgi:hypothetical protein
VSVIVAVIQTGAFSFFFYHVIRGLKGRISALEQTIKSQNATIKSLEKGFSCLDDVNDKYISRLKIVHEHFDLCINDLVQIKERQIKLRDEEREDLVFQNRQLKNVLKKQPEGKSSGPKNTSMSDFNQSTLEKSE